MNFIKWIKDAIMEKMVYNFLNDYQCKEEETIEFDHYYINVIPKTGGGKEDV